MGLAASQARLLTLTSRINDSELRTQSLANQKMRLAAMSDAVSTKYTQALNNQTLKITKNGDEMAMTYETLLASGYGVMRTSDSIVANSSMGTSNTNNGLIKQFRMPNNAVEFATFAERLGVGVVYSGGAEAVNTRNTSSVTYARMMNFDENGNFVVGHPSNHTGVQQGYEYFRDNSQYREKVLQKVQSDGYVLNPSLSGVYAEVENNVAPRNGGTQEQQDLYNQLQTPEFLIQGLLSGYLQLTNSEGKPVSLSSATGILTQYDSSDDAAAESEYDSQMNKINRKEKQLDMQMKQLETENSAMQSEYESVKSIIGEHAEKDFSLFG